VRGDYADPPPNRPVSLDELARHDGVVYMSRRETEAGITVTVERADPLVRIWGPFWRYVRQRTPDLVETYGQVFKIHAVNETVIYRLDVFDPQRDIFLASRPD
jgi:hypothetical protein